MESMASPEVVQVRYGYNTTSAAENNAGSSYCCMNPGIIVVLSSVFALISLNPSSLTANIVFDRIPPKPESFVIDNGQGWTNHPEKKVNFQIKANGAHEMAIGTDPTLKSASWEPYRAEIGML